MRNAISAVAVLLFSVLLVIGCSEEPATNPCDGVQCPAGQQCRNGSCVAIDAGTAIDAGQDAGEDAGQDAGEDAGVEPGYDGGFASSQIQAARDTADGTGLTLQITGAPVTYVKPAVGNDPAGFFVQAEPEGPALFIAVDPALLNPVPAVGDVVSFTITQMATRSTLREASAIDETTWTRDSTGFPVATFIQDLTLNDTFVANLGDYESELIKLTGTIEEAFGFGGPGHVSARIVTSGYPTISDNLRLRVPTALPDEMDLVQGCGFTVEATPLWRFFAQAQPSAWRGQDFPDISCPSPKLLSAVAASSTQVQLNFDRRISPATVNVTAFTFDNGLTASAATVNGRIVTIDTSAQVGGTTYTVDVANTVTDTYGVGVDPSANSASFTGFVPQAVLRINEFNANITGGCDLIELRVVAGGSISGYVLQERENPTTGTLMTFPNMTVATNDYIVVHMNGGNAACNPGGAADETTAKDQYPVATYSANYDAAWDLYSTDPGLTNTDNVWTLYNALGGIMDAVLTSDDATGTAAAGSETQAATVAAANHWQMVGGGIPAGGFVDDDFSAHAVLDLNATGTTAAGTSIQRTDDADTNDKTGWTTGAGAAPTWGANNAGQVDF